MGKEKEILLAWGVRGPVTKVQAVPLPAPLPAMMESSKARVVETAVVELADLLDAGEAGDCPKRGRP